MFFHPKLSTSALCARSWYPMAGKWRLRGVYVTASLFGWLKALNGDPTEAAASTVLGRHHGPDVANYDILDPGRSTAGSLPGGQHALVHSDQPTDR